MPQVVTGDAGVSWPIYAARDGPFKLFPFARAGATCSNNLTFRPFPSLFESQIPLYLTEKANKTFNLRPDETIYTLWIGTNDVGVNSLIVGQGANGATIVDTVSCAVNWITTLYKSGARNFLFQNVSQIPPIHLFRGRAAYLSRCTYQMIPLQHTILYSANSYPNRYWTEDRNTTAWAVFMTKDIKS